MTADRREQPPLPAPCPEPAEPEEACAGLRGFPCAPLPPDPALCLESDQLRRRSLERRVLQKIEEAEGYGFGLDEQRMLNAFFDMAQEYDSRRDLLTICVLLPMIFFDQEMRVYLRSGQDSWRLARCLHLPQQLPPFEPPPRPAVRGANFYAPIKGRKDTGELLGFPLEHGVIGWIEIVGGAALSSSRQLFFEKYAGRIGYQMHNRLARAKNREHLTFIQNLVADIGHNVIVPNMTFKLFFNRLRGSITALERLLMEAPHDTPRDFLNELDIVQTRLRAQYEEISHHYEQTSLFLETLLRRRHFEEGRYVLEKRLVNLRKQVVEPQVERFRPRLTDRGVCIDLSMGGIPDKPVQLMADLGLIAQVYANLFSNAVKYTRTVTTPEGQTKKFMAYGWDILPDAFGPNRPGVKLNVFTTGPTVPQAERNGLFQPGFRASTTGSEHGTGHGLAFVRQVVDLHGGVVGYEAAELGNNFYIVLPIEPQEQE
ncbi:MAG TPA: HAMP domain-containing sensor histidine kinase [Humidesulfovibrio sp.]|uniref:sensor histidine kinase n=1 Tax=Humidesulfovibrio sp. TaxID=2910988 RepID=UPI002BBF1E7D|nr:HAMP domain-containing sensor histidine kinase [Humidesulfovibrio sp.]HWR03265.1 HAMP domain-containing sensor histidine kinase [Humidesulfovibrio sp.]